MEEITFYNDQSVSVTSARVIMNELTFALRNISSVRTLVEPPSHAIDIILIIIGIMTGIMGFCVTGVGSGADSGAATGGGIFIVIIAIAFVVLGIFLYVKKKPTYYVYLGTNAGEKRGIRSQDKPYIETIVSAINEAIVYKG
jgi:hypothetical protein